MKRFKHPITGEIIGLGEHLSWMAQNAIRRWEFVGVVTLVTVVCWSIQTSSVLTWWNYAASYSAVFIELVVGIAMYQQTRSDAQVIRKILAMETHQFAELKELIERVEEDLEVYHDSGKGDVE
jgi:hypothetical protein